MTQAAERKRMPLMQVKFESLGGATVRSLRPLVHAENASSMLNFSLVLFAANSKDCGLNAERYIFFPRPAEKAILS